MTDVDFSLYREQVSFFYFEQRVEEDSFAEYLQSGELVIDRTKILQYLQSALFDEKVVEITLDNDKEIFYARLHDDPTTVSDDDGEYTFGGYLSDFSHIVSLPLEPGLGNASLRRSGYLRIRIFVNDYSVDLVTKYQQIIYVDKVPMLRLDFPQIAHVRSHDREFRAHAPAHLNFRLVASRKGEKSYINGVVHNISANGIAFVVSKKQYRLLHLGENLEMKIYLDDEMILTVAGKVCHVSKLRHRQGIEYVCGMELYLDSLQNRSRIGQLVATVQRAHLQEISRKSDYYGVHLII